VKGRLGAAEWLLEAVSPCEAFFRGHRWPRAADAVVYCFGQSHSIMLRRAWKRGLYRSRDRALRFEFLLSDNKEFPVDSVVTRSETGADVVCPQLERAFNEHDVFSGSRETWLLSMSHTNAYNMYGLFEPDPLFDFVHPARPDLPVRPEAQLLPYEAVRTKFVQAARGLDRLFKCLPRKNVTGIIHLEGPPPNPSREYCSTSVDQVLLRGALKRDKGVPVSPREFRMKLWKCQSDVHQQICIDNGVTYVTPPQEALDEEGYLVPVAWHGATHASAWYGALALGKIESVIANRRTASHA